jgi:hypothetical protein
MELEVKGGSITVGVGGEKRSSHFEVEREERGTVTLVTDADGQTDRITFLLVDDKTIRWTVFPGKPVTVTFRRENPGKAP